MNPAYLSPIANHLWQSTLFAGVAGLLTLALRKQSRASAPWGVAGGLVQISHPAFCAHRAGRSYPMADGSGDNASPTCPVVMDEVSQPFTAPAVSSAVVAAAPPAANPLPAILLGIWAMRIPRHRVFVVDSLAAHPGCGSRRVARAA